MKVFNIMDEKDTAINSTIRVQYTVYVYICILTRQIYKNKPTYLFNTKSQQIRRGNFHSSRFQIRSH